MATNELHVLFLLCLQINAINSDEILVLQPFGSQSHRHIVTPIAEQLGKRGHHVTFVSTYSFGKSIPPNVTEITYPQFKTHFKILQNITADTIKHGWGTDILKRYYEYHSELCKQFYNSGLLQNWMSEGKKFPIVMIDSAMHECILPLWRQIGHSLILINTGLLNPWVLRSMHVHTPYAQIPFTIVPFNNHMTFIQRCINTLCWMICNYITDLSQTAFYNHVILPYFPNTTPHDETMKDISLVLVNADPVITPPCPTLPTVVRIGGIQCRPAQPLPDSKLKSFVDGSDENGFILFSFGSIINGNLIDEKLRNAFIAAFAQIKQRVVWKYEEELTGLPSNVMTIDWIPQQDLLGHPKIRAFISHGGLQGLQEGIYNAVPQICLPLTTDQPSVVAITSALGIVIKLDPNSVTVEEIVHAINKASEDVKMRETVEYYSKIFHDREEKPMDKAIYWIEYVLRYGGALHLQTAAANLNFFQYYLIDVGAFAFVILISIILLFWFGIKKLIATYYPNLSYQLRNLSFKIKTT